MGFDPISLAIEGGLALGKAIIGSHAASKAADTQQTAAQNTAAAYAPIAAGAVPAYQKQLAMYGIQVPQNPTNGQARTPPAGAPVVGTAVPAANYSIGAAQPYSLAALTTPAPNPMANPANNLFPTQSAVTTGSAYGR